MTMLCVATRIPQEKPSDLAVRDLVARDSGEADIRSNFESRLREDIQIKGCRFGIGTPGEQRTRPKRTKKQFRIHLKGYPGVYEKTTVPEWRVASKRFSFTMSR